MDIFKLIFEHDIILEHLAGTEDPRHTAKKELSIEDFMKPTPTYAKYYLTGTQLEQQKFGLSALSQADRIFKTLEQIFAKYAAWNQHGEPVSSLENFLHQATPYQYLIFHPEKNRVPVKPESLSVDEHTNVRDRLPALTHYMDEGFIIMYVEKSHDGIDVHFFTAKNLYEDFFTALQPVASPNLRYFSINGKKVNSERSFYFETWTLERPPHGFEEVTQASRLR